LPKKDGKEDPLDALRYDVINWLWRDSELPLMTRSTEATSSTYKYQSKFGSPKGF